MITKTDCYLKPNTSLKAVLREFREKYNQYVDVFYNSHIKTLPPGATLPAKNKIYSDIGRSEFKKECYKYQELANYIFDAQLERVHKKMSETPNADISAMIGMLATRESITEDELTHLLNEYGDNHQVYRSLQDIGKKHGFTILDDEIMHRESGLRDLQHNIEKALTIHVAESHNNSYYDFLSMPIDAVLTDTANPLD